MPLDSTRAITQFEHDPLWNEVQDRGEVDWHWIDIERRQSIPKQLGRGGSRIIGLQPGLKIYINTHWYRRSLCLDYPFTTEGALISNYYLAGGHRIINPGIQIEDDREEVLVMRSLLLSGLALSLAGAQVSAQPALAGEGAESSHSSQDTEGKETEASLTLDTPADVDGVEPTTSVTDWMASNQSLN